MSINEQTRLEVRQRANFACEYWLNRPPLVAYRVRLQRHREEQRLLEHYREMVGVLGRLYRQQAELLEEQQRLLQEQRALIERLARRDEG